MHKELVCFYDFRVCPATYDFVSFIAHAETCRIRRGLESLQIVFVKGPKNGYRDDNLGRDKLNETFFHNVILPSLGLLKSITKFDLLEPSEINTENLPQEQIFPRGYTRQKPVSEYLGSYLVLCQLMGDKFPKLEAPRYAKELAKNFIGDNKKPFVTITARETRREDVDFNRSLDPNIWQNNVDQIIEAGYIPIVIRDTDFAYGQPQLFSKTLECPQASLHLHFRIAIYELAFHNFIKSNGPSILLFYSDSDSTAFFRINEKIHCNSERWFYNKFGMIKGSNWPFTKRKTQICWKPENFRNIKESLRSKANFDGEAANEFNSKQNAFASTQIGFSILLRNLRTGVMDEDLKLIEGIETAFSKYNLQKDESIIDKIIKNEGTHIPKGTANQIFQKIKQRNIKFKM